MSSLRRMTTTRKSSILVLVRPFSHHGTTTTTTIKSSSNSIRRFTTQSFRKQHQSQLQLQKCVSGFGRPRRSNTFFRQTNQQCNFGTSKGGGPPPPKNTSNNNNQKILSRRERRKLERLEMKQEKKFKNKTSTSSGGGNGSRTNSTTTTTTGFMNHIHTIRNILTLSSCTKLKFMEIGKRFPFFIVLVLIVSWDETSPYILEQTIGPSMLPTIHPMGDIYLRQTNCLKKWFHYYYYWFGGETVLSNFWKPTPPTYQVGDVVIFQKQSSDNYYSCKRIIGLEHEQVLIYGQYAHLFRHRKDKGIVSSQQQQQQYLMDGSGVHDINEQEQPFAVKYYKKQQQLEQEQSKEEEYSGALHDDTEKDELKRTFTIPPGHVWVEGDNPLDSLDSRHYGPIPIDKLRGRLVMRLWPLWRENQQPSKYDEQDQQQQQHNQSIPLPPKDTLIMSRHRPIPLSRETLLHDGYYNLHPKPIAK